MRFVWIVIFKIALSSSCTTSQQVPDDASVARVHVRSGSRINHCIGIYVANNYIITSATCIFHLVGRTHDIVVCLGASREHIDNCEQKSNSDRVVHHKSLNLVLIRTQFDFDKTATPLAKVVETSGRQKGLLNATTCFGIGFDVRDDIQPPVEARIAVQRFLGDCYDDNAVCAHKANESVCQKDSGGPLICDGFVVGILATASVCFEDDVGNGIDYYTNALALRNIPAGKHLALRFIGTGKSTTKRQHVLRTIFSRRGVIFSAIFILFLIIFLNYLIEFQTVTKITHTYNNLKRRDNTKSKAIYNDLLRAFHGGANESIPASDSQKTTSSWPKCEVIHIGFVCSGYKSNLQLHTMLKSLLFHRHNPLHFHIVVNRFSENVLTTLFNTWNIPKLNVSYYEMNPLLPDVRWVPNSHYSGMYGLLKLMFSKFMPKDVDKMIVLDTDLTVITDIYDLWAMFESFDFIQAIGLVENESDFYLSSKRTVWPAIGKGFNTGVILYRLDKLRDVVWEKMWSRVAKKAAMMYGATSLGDQDIMNAVLKQYPNLVYQVPCYWNTQLSDHTTSHECYDNNKIKIIHWNSPKKYNVVNKDGDYFRSISTTFLEMNGYLVTSSLYECTNNTSVQETATDVCAQFKRAKTSSWRTLLFFRNFEYIPVAHDVTFVAQLSYDRLQMLELLSHHWEGPISLALYVTDPEFEEAQRYIDGSDVLQERTNIAYHAVFKKGDYHPINLLRNVGLHNVNTPYVFLADIDFVPMFGLHQTLRNAISAIGNMNKKALIVPAFESQRYRSHFPRNKNELLQMLELKSLFTFRYDVWASGHAATNYSRWSSAQTPYTVKWEPDFEPYVVVKRNVVEYDIGFMGFGWNKVSHIMELECQNYEFIVLPNAFIVHRPHSPSYDIAKFRLDPIYRMCLQNLKEEFVEGLRRKYGRVFDKVNAQPPETPVDGGDA